MFYHGEFKEEKYYYRPSYGRIKYDGSRFVILKSKTRQKEFYPISFLHNPLKARLRFLNLLAKYHQRDHRHLNIGLGIGDYELFLSNLPLKLYSIEHPGAPALKEELSQKNIAVSKTQLYLADICKDRLPFEDNFFDSISLLEVIEHLPVEKLPFAVSEVVRVLKRKGYLYLSTPNLASLENRLLLLFKGKLLLYMPQLQESIFDHLRYYSVNEIRILFTRFNCQVAEQIFFTDNLTYRAKANLWQVAQATIIKFLVKLNKNFNNSLLLLIQKK